MNCIAYDFKFCTILYIIHLHVILIQIYVIFWNYIKYLYLKIINSFYIFSYIYIRKLIKVTKKKLGTTVSQYKCNFYNS